uniref:Uncharacterized protein n=1 Tax=Megaselia scalaris TaxID=36166 RepID=T1GE00_MEGSC
MYIAHHQISCCCKAYQGHTLTVGCGTRNTGSWKFFGSWRSFWSTESTSRRSRN